MARLSAPASHLLVQAGALDLHDHLFARAQPRAVHLADRRRGERHAIELGERGGERAIAERRARGLHRLAGRHGRHVALQTLERARHLGRQQIFARAEQLAELDVGRAEIREHAREPLAEPLALAGRAAVRGDAQAEAEPRDHLAEPVTREHERHALKAAGGDHAGLRFSESVRYSKSMRACRRTQ
jgi:hypothetical protein